MTTDEQKAYARGYASGRKFKVKSVASNRHYAQQQAFLERAFLAALPACIEVKGWKQGEEPITNLKDRTQLAWQFAIEALKTKRIAP